MGKSRLGLVAGALALTTAIATAVAGEWCGENGLVRLAFDENGTAGTLTVAPEANGTTTVEVYAVLTDVDPVQRKGEAFLNLGGFELQLAITGAEGRIVGQTFPVDVLNIAQENGRCIAGFTKPLRLDKDGATELVKWTVVFFGEVADVVFGLDASGLHTCASMPDCAASGTQGIYIGSLASHQINHVFGVGYVPAVLNPSGEPELTPVRGHVSWQDVGAYTALE